MYINNFKKNLITFPLSIFLVFILILSLCLVLTSCSQINDLKSNILSKFSGEKEADKAVKTAKDFFNTLIKKDYEGAYQYIYNNKNKTFDDFKNEMKNVTDIISFEVNWVEVKNNIAIVDIDFIDSYDGEEKIYKDMQVSLIKDEDENWKINFWN
jgi:predicted transcriptional regulator